MHYSKMPKTNATDIHICSYDTQKPRAYIRERDSNHKTNNKKTHSQQHELEGKCDINSPQELQAAAIAQRRNSPQNKGNIVGMILTGGTCKGRSRIGKSSELKIKSNKKHIMFAGFLDIFCWSIFVFKGVSTLGAEAARAFARLQRGV